MRTKACSCLMLLSLAFRAAAQENQVETTQPVLAKIAQVLPATGVSVVNEGTEKAGGAWMVNEFTGQAAFSVNLGGITNHHGLRYDLAMSYFGGGADKVHNTHLKYASTPWTGLGFSLETPGIQVQSAGGSAVPEDQTYYLTLGGQHELVPVPGAPNDFVLKSNPYVKLTRHMASYNRSVVDQCPSQTGTTTSFTATGIDYWVMTRPDGSKYEFGEPNAHCGGSNFEVCVPVVGHSIRYQPFYDMDGNGRDARVQQTFLLRRIYDRQEKFAIWFGYHRYASWIEGLCNHLSSTPLESFMKERSVYLASVYATNGMSQNGFRTSEIYLQAGGRAGEETYDPGVSNPLAQEDWLALERISYIERGVVQSYVTFNYGTTGRRMRLEGMSSQEPRFGTSRPLTTFRYDAQSPWRLSQVEDGGGRIVEFAYAGVPMDPAAGTTTQYQTLALPTLPAESRIAFSRQVGNKFYLQTENWSQGCGPGNANFVERLIEYENNGTFWHQRRVLPSPINNCPTAIDFFMSPDGKYAVWTYPVSGSGYSGGSAAKIEIHDLTKDGTSTLVKTFINDEDGGKAAFRLEIFAYPEWFALYNFENRKNISFYWKTGGTWNGPDVGSPNTCPADILPSTYAYPGNAQRTNNYSGDNEGVQRCLTFSGTVRVTPGPSFLAAIHDVNGHSILHVFAHNNGIKDYVKGLETSTPVLPNFTQAEAAENHTVPRPWGRNGGYHNNSTTNIAKIAVSENLIATVSGVADKDEWKYLYVLGWDGKQLRYLYDEPLLADMDPDDGVDQVDLYTSSDYFVLKNYDHENGSGSRDGIWFYKVSLNNWRVAPKVSLGVGTADLGNATQSDWSIKAYPDYIFLEKMQEGKEPEAYSPALVSYTDAPPNAVGGTRYHHLADTRVWAFDRNRALVNVSSQFRFGPTMYSGYMTTFLQGNFQTSGDYILTATTFKHQDQQLYYNATEYNVVRRSPADAGLVPVFDPVDIDAGQAMIGNNYSARPVQGGVMVTYFDIFDQSNSLLGLRFFPYARSATAVSSVGIKSAGPGSTGADLRTVNFTYPTTSPEGEAAPRLRNHISGIPNFKIVKKEYELGADVLQFVRDEPAARLADADKNLHGMPAASWTLPDKADWKKPGGTVTKFKTVSAAPDAALPQVFVTRNVKEEAASYFHRGYRNQDSYSTDFDSRNGQPRIRVIKSGPYYQVLATVFDHNLTGSTAPPFDLVRQTAAFQFASNPCDLLDPKDPCKNVRIATTFAASATANLQKMITSSIIVYDAQKRAKETWSWTPGNLGTSYAFLDGNPANPGNAGRWEKTSDVLRRQDAAMARCKSDAVTESDAQGVPTTRFYGGEDCDLLGTVYNSRLFSAALLTGEEEIVGGQCAAPSPCLGAFGRWEVGGSAVVQSAVVRSGKSALRVTSLYGPTINLKIRQEAGFMDRRKGFFVSAWIYATPGSNPAFRVEIRKNISPMTMGPEDQVPYQVDLVQEYEASQGAFPTGKWVKLEKTIPYETLTGYSTFGATPSNDYLRIWLGKGSAANTNAVYLDDVRLHPIDAAMETVNYDPSGRVTSSLDGNNDPDFIEYDAWGAPIGIRRKDGLVKSATATKLFNE